MDPDIKIIFFVKKSQYLPNGKVVAILDQDFNRKSLPSNLENSIEETWNSRIDTNPKLYNGTKFRLHSVSEASDKTLTLNLGVTCYKEYLGTNWAPNSKLLHSFGKDVFKNEQACMSDPVGVGSFVITSDNHVILLRRSNDCAESPGLWDCPGGHAEPEELVGKKSFEEIDLSSMTGEAVVKEIFDSIIREIRDEVNIPEHCLSAPQLIGIALNTTSACRPSIEFIVQCSKSSTEVVSLYKEGSQSEAEESTNIMTLPLNDMVSLEESHREIWDNMAPAGKGCIVLYRLANGLYDISKLNQ
ncbi:hypothetical protein LOTGIDRAFT_220828 [Lottia gigantea]|uniref:Nudix hydrolase domain-containing protein n=1 Tax=Lottia gigantea TaxID=225164 RepID=V3ZP87_LOTGI|nr:hypothetical protein LOTGIDRAFT_220828 [Lottia gigantea]ESO86152.1 hypothetical protein LOTGIDRAFT_220828 [Lottia gigantea]